MRSCLKCLIFACVLWLLAGSASVNAAPEGFLEGHLKIYSPKEVELAGETPSKMTTQNHAEYPLIVVSRDGKKQIARVTADENGNYRVALPPGEYVLDVQDRRRRHVRAKQQPFTVISNQTVRVDMTIDTGIR
jgi:Carboxypeptidase regulatory-like domain